MTSEKTARTQNLDSAPLPCGSASEKEAAARAAIEARGGRSISDIEWGRARTRLLEFGLLLRVWDPESKTGESELPKAA